MPRSLILGNGRMLIGFDAHLQMRDLYFPYVGMEDHTTYGNAHKLGFYVEGKGFAWTDDGSWTVVPGYKPETLVANSTLENKKLGIGIRMEDAIHPIHNVLIRRLYIRTLDNSSAEVRCFFHHNFKIYGDTQKDTAFYEPYTNSVIHFRQSRYFLVGGETSKPVECHIGRHAGPYDSVLHSMQGVKGCGLSSFSIGKANYRGLEGTWRDAEDGELGENTIEQGSVDSTVGIYCHVDPGEETETTLTLSLGKTLEEVVQMHKHVMEETPDQLIRNTHNYWKSWVQKGTTHFGSLHPSIVDLYKRSVMMVRLHADDRGGIIAAADSDIMAFNRDTYTYVWPRDGAFIATSLDQCGYSEVSKRFFEFAARVQSEDGYMLHKYNPDGSVGSSWHPWYRDGQPQLPIQEDETALVLYAMARHFDRTKDFEFLQSMYERFIKKAAEFLCNFREESTGLPLQSYDLWEEHKGIFTYTTATTIAGLEAAAHMSHMLGHYTHSEMYHRCADEMKQAMLFHLYDEKVGRFVKKIKRHNGQTTDIDVTPDASIAMVWKLGILPPDDPRVVSTMQQLKDILTVKTPIGGMARYTEDYYQSQEHPSDAVPGNPWIITTLWYAQWVIARAKNHGELEEARSILEWATSHASTTGILAEQLHPRTGAPLSVAPLAWSHAVFAETVVLFVKKEKEVAQSS